MILKVSVCVFVNVRVVKNHLLILDPRESVADLPLAGPQSLHFSPVQDDPRLERLQDVIIAPGFRIAEDIGQTSSQCFFFRLFVGRVSSVTSGISKPIFSSMISSRAMSAAP